ncbi:ATP-binding protein [Streptomyces chattanoogensis]
MLSKTMPIAALLLAGPVVLGSAGVATAASPIDSATSAVTGVVASLPVDRAANALPAGAPEALAAGQNALGSGAATLPMTADKSLPTVAAAGAGLTDTATDLLGGLPVAGDAAKGGLPTDAVTGAVPGSLPGVG